MSTPAPILVDTSGLISICKTNYDEKLYTTLQMETTNICNEEIRRQKSSSDSICHQQACRRYLELLRQENNPDIRSVGTYKSHVEDQGEKSLERVFSEYPDAVKYILLFDFDAIEKFNDLRHDIGGEAINTKISLPNYGFELLRQRDHMDDEEYCKATYQMGVEENWMKRHALKLDNVSPIDCPQFP